MNIYIGNLSYSLSENDLYSLFAEFGSVENVHIIQEVQTGRSKGFGFVEMPNEDEGRSAIDGLNDREVEGRKVKVNQAKPKIRRPHVDLV